MSASDVSSDQSSSPSASPPDESSLAVVPSMTTRKRRHDDTDRKDNKSEAESSSSSTSHEQSKKARRHTEFLKKVEETVYRILSCPKDKPPSVKDYMDLYTGVYMNLVEANILTKRNKTSIPEEQPLRKGCTSKELYRCLERALKKKLKEIAQTGRQLSDLLTFYSDAFALYKFHVTFLNGMFAYMNRVWVRTVNKEDSNETIYSFAMLQWRTHVFNEFNSDLAESIFTLVKTNREDLAPFEAVLRTVVDSYVIMSDPTTGIKAPTTTAAALEPDVLVAPLDIYCDNFEKPFLSQSKDYYAQLANDSAEEKTISAYLSFVQDFLGRETKMGEGLLHSSTVPKLSATVLDEFLRAKSDFLLESMPGLIASDDTESLKLLFQLLSQLQEFSMEPTIQVFKKDFVSRGQEALNAFQNALLAKEIEGKYIPLQYVDSLVNVCQTYDRFISSCFNHHVEFRKAFDEGAVTIVNQNIHTSTGQGNYNLNKTPELLGRYSHAILVTNSLIPPDDTPEALSKLFLLLKFTESKDSFEKYYNWNLLNRLINKTSSSDDNEAQVIAHMKTNFGQDYSMKSYQLTQDARISDDISRKFKAAQEQALQFEFHIIVFKNGSCRLPECPPMNIPAELTPIMNNFIEYYGKQYEGRTLTWYHNKSYGELIYNAGPSMAKKYTFTVSTYQMAVLLLFNERTKWSMEEIMENTLIEAGILSQIMPILERTKLLTKTSSGAYELFQSYKSNKHKHDINVPIKTELKTGSEDAVDEEVQNQRNFVLQAVMVRLMKASQSMSHSDLIAETIAAVSSRFKPNVTRIKRTIDCLIEREYLKRDEVETDRYVYIS